MAGRRARAARRLRLPSRLSRTGPGSPARSSPGPAPSRHARVESRPGRAGTARSRPRSKGWRPRCRSSASGIGSAPGLTLPPRSGNAGPLGWSLAIRRQRLRPARLISRPVTGSPARHARTAGPDGRRCRGRPSRTGGTRARQRPVRVRRGPAPARKRARPAPARPPVRSAHPVVPRRRPGRVPVPVARTGPGRCPASTAARTRRRGCHLSARRVATGS